MKRTLIAIGIFSAILMGVIGIGIYSELHSVGWDPFRKPERSAQDQVRRGVIHYRAANYEQAIARFQSAIELDPKSRVAQLDLANTLAHSYQMTGNVADLQRSAAEYKVLLEADPQDQAALRGLGYLYLNAGQAERAGQYLARAAQVQRPAPPIPEDEEVPPLSSVSPPLAETPQQVRRVETEGMRRVSASEADEHLLRKVEPAYPPIAQAAQLHGNVVLEVVIGTKGAVGQVRALSGNPVLIQSTIDAVRQWRYRPFQAEGKPVEVHTTVTVTFR